MLVALVQVEVFAKAWLVAARLNAKDPAVHELHEAGGEVAAMSISMHNTII